MKHLFLQPALAGALTIGVSGCGSPPVSESQSSNLVRGGFISPNFFLVDSAQQPFTATEVEGQIESATIFRPASEEFDPTLAEPSRGGLKCGFAIDEVTSPEPSTLQFIVDANSSGCAEEAADSNPLHTEIKLYLKLTCSDFDLSALDLVGKSALWAFQNLPYRGLCAHDVKSTVFMNADLLVAPLGNRSGDSLRLVSAFMSDNGNPCEMSAGDGVSTIDGCTYFSKGIEIKEATTVTKAAAFRFQEVHQDFGSPQFTGGVLEFNFGWWEGTMVYSESQTWETTDGISRASGNLPPPKK